MGHCVCREGWGRLSALLVIMVTLGTEVQMVGDQRIDIPDVVISVPRLLTPYAHITRLDQIRYAHGMICACEPHNEDICPLIFKMLNTFSNFSLVHTHTLDQDKLTKPKTE